MTATIEVLTFRKGLLARLGHDLCLSAERFMLELRAGSVHAELLASSLRVLGAMRDGVLDRAALSTSDRAEIERAMQHEVLHAAWHPKVSFTAEAKPVAADGFELEGTLELHGVRAPLIARGRRERGRIQVEIDLTPSRFGIAPYRALGGALKLDDRVRVRVTLVLPAELEPLALPELVRASARWTAGEAP